ncbi:MAG: hypothetical protein P8Z68_01535 [Kineosporiaceae bacterium]
MDVWGSSPTDVVAGVAPLAGTPAPQVPDAAAIGPGTVGFLVTFALVVVTVLLVRSMVGHLRRVRYGPDAQGSGAQGNDASRSGSGARKDPGPGQNGR